MIVSKYTKIFKYKKSNFVYNTVSNFLCEVDESLEEIIKKKIIKFEDIENDEIWNLLKKNKIITENEKDDFLAYKSYIQNMRFSNNILNLTLTPTMRCNFNCPYCFEKIKKGTMSKELVENIVKFVNNLPNIKYVNLTWFGGEPLLVSNIIENISSLLCNSERFSYSSNIITNGYFLTIPNLLMLEKCKVSFVQLSMDGIFENHNQKRYTKTNKDTFSTIISNLDAFHKSEINLKIGIRINIDHTNKESLKDIDDYFCKKYENDHRISVNYAFIIDTTKGENDNTIVDEFEKFELRCKTNLLNNQGKSTYPDNQIVECAVRNKNTVAIDAEGYVYKCWEIIGNKEYIIGHLTKDGIEVTNPSLLNRYLYGADHLENEKCRECSSLWVCGGGCPHKRIENEFNNRKFVICDYENEKLDKYIYERIKQYQNEKN